MADSGTFLVGFHRAATSNHAKLNIAMPPVIRPEPLASFVYKPFNSKECAVSLAMRHPEFESTGCVAVMIKMFLQAQGFIICQDDARPFVQSIQMCLSPLLELSLLWRRTYM